MIDRRTMLLATGAAALTAPLSTARATELSVGAIKARVVSDGHMAVGLDRIVASYQAGDVKAALTQAGVTGEGLRFALNITLLTIGGKTVLVDAGAGGTWVETAGKLPEALEALGIDPGKIDLVVLTHGHADHLWGVIDDFDDTLRFKSAGYVFPEAEFAFWTSPGVAEAAGAAEGLTAGTRRVLKRIEGKLTRAKAGAEIVPGLAYLDAAGHTPGQCAVMATSGSDRLLIAADTLFHPVSVAYPDWRPAQDMDGERAVATRRRLLDIAAAEKAAVVAYHAPGGGLGRIEREGMGFRWRPMA